MSVRVPLAAAFATIALLAVPPALAQQRRAAAAAQAGFPVGQPLSITVNNDGFVPRTIVLRQGRAYTLNFRNTSDRKHSFSARTFFEIARVNPDDQNWVVENKVELEPGQSARVRIVAPTTPNAVYEFRSLQIADAGENMKGTIQVR